MNTDEREASLAEARHEIVLNFAKKLSQGLIFIRSGSVPDRDSAKECTHNFLLMQQEIRVYLSGKADAKQLDELEDKIFDKMMYFQSISVLQERSSDPDEIRSELDQIKARIASTNQLLQSTMIILTKLLEKIEKDDD